MNKETTHQDKIASPLRYLSEVVDKRQQAKCDYSMEMLWKLVLMGICAGKENVPAISQWLEDNAEALYEHGFRNLKGEQRLPSEISCYRFFWAVEGQIKKLEEKLKSWVVEVSKTLTTSAEALVFDVDGKHIKGTKRPRAGEKAIQLVSIYLQNLGLTLVQEKLEGDEAKLAEKMMVHMQDFEGLTWLLTGDAAFNEKPMVTSVVDQGGMYLFELKDNRSALKQFATFAFSLPSCEQDSSHHDCESRSGEIWLRDIDSRPVDDHVVKQLPQAQQFVRVVRTIVDKATGEIKSQETDYAITSAHADAKTLYHWWRGHWAIENRSHHKRDTIWREDHCRMRRGAQVFAALRNLVLSLFHLSKVPSVLRQTRRFSSKPQLIPAFLGF